MQWNDARVRLRRRFGVLCSIGCFLVFEWVCVCAFVYVCLSRGARSSIIKIKAEQMQRFFCVFVLVVCLLNLERLN